MTAGVYAIYLTGTPYVYVGESKDIERRWVEHRDEWVWPNEGRHEMLYECADAKLRKRLEVMEYEEHKKDCYLVLAGKDGEGSRAASLEQRRAWMADARSTLTQEHLRAAGAHVGNVTQRRRKESGLTCFGLTPEEHREAARRGGRAGGSKGGKIGGHVSGHNRWHVARGIVSPKCNLCVAATPNAGELS